MFQYTVVLQEPMLDEDDLPGFRTEWVEAETPQQAIKQAKETAMERAEFPPENENQYVVAGVFLGHHVNVDPMFG